MWHIRVRCNLPAPKKALRQFPGVMWHIPDSLGFHSFLTILAIPGRQTLTRRIQELDAELTEKMTQRLRDPRHGPWLLTCDAATNRGDPLVSVDAMNGAGECWHINLCHSGEASQTAAFLKDSWLLERSIFLR